MLGFWFFIFYVPKNALISTYFLSNFQSHCICSSLIIIIEKYVISLSNEFLNVLRNFNNLEYIKRVQLCISSDNLNFGFKFQFHQTIYYFFRFCLNLVSIFVTKKDRNFCLEYQKRFYLMVQKEINRIWFER